jgi:Fic-DOC domain mobile mystery protein B
MTGPALGAGPDLGDDPEEATPIDDEQRQGLKASWIATRADLNQAEYDNILGARLVWRRRLHGRGSRRVNVEKLLDHQTVRDLHRDMYGEVWAWAGRYRTSDTNIGVPWHRITEATAQLLGNAVHWFTDEASMPTDRAAARLHHKLVEIHPFPNGNGRHSRELTDLVLLSLDQEPFTWGQVGLVEASQTRRAYIDALIGADHGDYGPLESFVRS